MQAAIEIKKSSGDKEQFDLHKLERSLEQSGATPEIVKKVSLHVEGEVRDGMTTEAIYRHAFFVLKKLQSPAAARYSLKRAVSLLGPTGYPFEQFIAELWRARGFSAVTNAIVQGACAEHEIDIVAWNDRKLIMTEAKFHGDFGLKSDFKVALYVRGRAEDVSKKTHQFGGQARTVDEFWLVTNTNFSKAAIEYSACAGIKLLGWTYPATGNLHDLIDDTGLHPLTCLTTLNQSQLKTLFDKGVVLCKSIKENGDILASLGLPKIKTDEIMAESRLVCEPRANLR